MVQATTEQISLIERPGVGTLAYFAWPIYDALLGKREATDNEKCATITAIHDHQYPKRALNQNQELRTWLKWAHKAVLLAISADEEQTRRNVRLWYTQAVAILEEDQKEGER